jgi:RNA polymerase sigma-70 factor (sigma-E family)
MFRVALLLTGDWHAAQDLVQETLARMYSRWDGMGHVENRAAYAHTVLTRVFLSGRRRRSAGERPTDSIPETTGNEVDAALRRTLIEALLRLPERDRAVVVLRYLADHSVEQVAQQLNRSPGAIRVQAKRALAKLRVALGESYLDLVCK